MFGVGLAIVRVALDAGRVFGAGACSYSRVSADYSQALKCNFIWDLILGVSPLDARHPRASPQELRANRWTPLLPRPLQHTVSHLGGARQKRADSRAGLFLSVY